MSKFACNHCGEEIGIISSIRGQWIPCPGCHESIHVPLYDDPQADKQVLVAEEPIADISESHSFSPEAPEEVEFYCPSCGVGLNEDVQFCIGCGFNLKPDMPARVASLQAPAYSMGEYPPEKGLMLGAFVTGAIGALIAGLLWGLVAYVTKMEFGYGALGVGFLAGVGTCLGTSRRGSAVGMIAVMMAILGLIVGKVVIADWVVPSEVPGDPSESAIMEVIDDDELMADAAYYDLVDKGRVDQRVQAWVENSKDGELPPKELERQFQRVGDRIGEYFLLPLEKKKIVAGNYLVFLSEEYAKLDRFTRVKAMLSFWDILWAVLAISTAYRICSREKA